MQHMLHQIKAPQLYTDLGLKLSVMAANEEHFRVQI